MTKNRNELTAALNRADSLTLEISMYLIKSLPYNIQNAFLYRAYETDFQPREFSVENFRSFIEEDLRPLHGMNLRDAFAVAALDHIDFDAFATIVYEIQLKKEIENSRKR